jgi:hypothetical protein
MGKTPEVDHVPPPKEDNPDLPPERLPFVGNDSTFHPEKIREVANKHLMPDHGALAGKGSGTLHDFQMQVDTEPAGRVTSEQLGDYPAVVNGLQITVKNAYDHVGSVYDAFLQSYDSFAQSLAKVGQNYGDTEDANKNNAGNGHPKAV